MITFKSVTCDLKCRWRGWRCTTTRSTRSTRMLSTVWPSRWQGTCPSLLSFLLRFNLGLTTSLLHWTGASPMEKLQTYRVSQKNLALNLFEGWVTVSEQSVKPSPSAIPQTNQKQSFLGHPVLPCSLLFTQSSSVFPTTRFYCSTSDNFSTFKNIFRWKSHFSLLYSRL